MPSEILLFSVEGHVATITLNRPEARNALNSELLRALSRAVDRCESREEIEVVVLTGSDPAFCAGLDLKAVQDGSIVAAMEQEAAAGSKGGMFRRRPFPFRRKPLIAAVNGAAITGGLELALACDFILASERASFGDTHTRYGLQPSWGLTVNLPEAVGQRRAKEMSLTGRYIDARTALDWGLVNHVVAHAELLPAAQGLAADIVANDRAAVRRILCTYEETGMVSAGEGWIVEATAALEWLRAGRARPSEVYRRLQP